MTKNKKAEKEHGVTKTEMPDELRRTLLKTSWVVPVVTIVGLPAHAQTSNPTPCPQELIIPGRTLTCDYSAGDQSLYYLIDDTATPCTTLIQGSEDNFSIRLRFDKSGISDIIVSIRVYSPSELNGVTQRCNNTPVGLYEHPVSQNTSARSGAPWTAAFTLSRPDPNVSLSVTVSDIVLTPQ